MAHPVIARAGDMTWVRAEFPALSAAPEVAYLDSASTTQKPRGVLDAVARALGQQTASPGRGGYPWASRASAEIARVRGQVARFVGTGQPETIVFTSGATAAMNAVAIGWGMANLGDGDEIMYCRDDHTSTVAPWENLRDTVARFGVSITLVSYPRTVSGAVDVDDMLAAVTARTRLIVATHVHGVYGMRTAPSQWRDRIDPSIFLCVDCSQSAGHLPVDVSELRADFAVLAGHKMFAAPGVGVLYCAPRTHRSLRPFSPGGSGIEADASTMPGLLEGGTPNGPAIVSLGAAIEFIDRIGLEAIEWHTDALTRRLVEQLTGAPGIELRSGADAGSGIVSLRVPGMRPNDVGFVLAAAGMYVRAGGHCLRGNDGNVVRVSMHAYSTEAEVDRVGELLAELGRESR